MKFIGTGLAVVSPTALPGRTPFVDCVYIYKDAMFGRFYAICNCCSCCCGAMEAQRAKRGTPMIASSGYLAVVDGDLCAGCGECAGVCQFAAISVDDGFSRASKRLPVWAAGRASPIARRRLSHRNVIQAR